MSPEAEIQTKLRSVARRLRWFTVEARVLWCLLPGLVAALLLLAAYKLDRLDDPFALMALAAGLPITVGLLWGLVRPVSLLDAAMLADARLGLKERLSNAVIFSQSPEASPLIPAIVRDASRHAADVSARDVLPHRLNRTAWWSLVVVALIGATWFAPHYALGRSPQEVAVRRQMREEGKRLKEVAGKAKEEAKAKKLDSPAELAARLEKLAKELEKAKLSKKQALLKTGKLAAEVREAQKLAALAAGAGALGKASEALRSVPMATELGQVLARSVHERKPAELASKLSKMAQDARAGNLGSKQEQKALADDLRQMAGALGQAGLDDASAAAQAAADALERGDSQAAAEALQRAAQAAADAAQQAAANESMEEMAGALEEAQQDVAQADQACPKCGQVGCDQGAG